MTIEKQHDAHDVAGRHGAGGSGHGDIEFDSDGADGAFAPNPLVFKDTTSDEIERPDDSGADCNDGVGEVLFEEFEFTTSVAGSSWTKDCFATAVRSLGDRPAVFGFEASDSGSERRLTGAFWHR